MPDLERNFKIRYESILACYELFHHQITAFQSNVSLAEKTVLSTEELYAGLPFKNQEMTDAYKFSLTPPPPCQNEKEVIRYMHTKFWLRNVKVKLPLVRRRHKLDDNIKKYNKETEWEDVDWVLLSHDRDWWRKVVNAAMNLLQSP
jgi:hypothetical protein